MTNELKAKLAALSEKAGGVLDQMDAFEAFLTQLHKHKFQGEDDPDNEAAAVRRQDGDHFVALVREGLTAIRDRMDDLTLGIMDLVDLSDRQDTAAVRREDGDDDRKLH